MSILPGLATTVLILSACQSLSNSREDARWHLLLSHDSNGNVLSGAETNLVAAVRNGCNVRVAWGSVRTEPSRRSVEHVADIKWITVLNDTDVHAQIGDFLINLEVLGEPEKDHPRREEYGGTGQVVKWRASLRTDGSFDAVWFAPHSGEFVTRRPQRYPMKWYSDCQSALSKPLYMPLGSDG